MTNNRSQLKFDLEERTAKFGEDIIEFAKKLPKTAIAPNYKPTG